MNRHRLVLLWLVLCGCGSELPARYVVERNLGGFAYRRYQKTIGVEVPIEGNEAVGHTATYLRRSSGTQVSVATAFVTVYSKAQALTAEVREHLHGLEGYRFSTLELEGQYVWLIDGGQNERWVAWVSSKYLVKLGAPEGEQIPEAIAATYLELYPSDLDEHGRAQPEASSAGKSRAEKAEGEHTDEPEKQLPANLRENAPR